MYLKLQVNLTAIIPDICACSETAWAWVGETCVKKHVKFNFHSLEIYTWNLIWRRHMKKCVKLLVNFYCHSLWSYMWNLMWSTCENVYERDWIVSHSFHISHVKYTWKGMWNWKWTSTAIDVNLYVKPHVKYMWKCVWKGLHCFTPFSHNFHIYFTMLNSHTYEICAWNTCEKQWKTCERCVKMTHFSHIFSQDFSHTYS